MSRNRPDILQAWFEQVSVSTAGKQLIREVGERIFQETLSRSFASLKRLLLQSSTFSASSSVSLFKGLLARNVEAEWLARWWAILFDVSRDTLDTDHRIPPRELVTLRRVLLNVQAQTQGALLSIARDESIKRAVSQVEGDLRKRNDELKAARNQYKNLVDRLDEIIFTLDSSGRFESISGGGLKALGLTATDLIGKKISEVTPRRNRGQVRELRGRLLREKRLKGVTLRTVDAKGKEVVLEVAASLMVRRGKAPGALGIARDVTDRTQLEEKVRESKDYLELLVESSVDGIIATDQRGEITLFSRGAEEIFGYELSEVLHKPVGAFFALPKNGEQSLFDLISEGGGRIGNRECVCRRRDGREVVVSYSASFLHDAKGEVIGLIGVCKDVTERRRAEEDVREKNEELEAYARTVSHDLRGPLASIHGFSSLLEETFGDRLTEGGRQYLVRIQENARMMGRLISDVLEFSTVGRKNGSPYWVSIGPLMDALSEEFAPQFAKVGARMEIQGPLPQIMGDETRLRQVFSNLITNALRHLSGVKNPLIEVSAEAAERGHILCVADNGCGIPPELHNRVFDLFFTSTSSAEEKGTGLGLAIVKKAVEAYGGRVWVESKPDCGARFNIHLPQTKI